MRKAVRALAFSSAMALIGFGMSLGALLEGEALTGPAFYLAWSLLSVGFLLAVVWSVVYLRLV